MVFCNGIFKMFEKIVERKIFFKIRVFLTKGETEAHVAQGIILGGTDSMKIMIIYQKDGIGSDFIRNIVSFVNSMAGYNIRDFKANLLMGRILIVRGAGQVTDLKNLKQTQIQGFVQKLHTQMIFFLMSVRV